MKALNRKLSQQSSLQYIIMTVIFFFAYCFFYSF